MATELDIQELTRVPSRLLEHVRHGDEVTLTESGLPVARVVPIKSGGGARGGFGMFKGMIEVSDDFCAPLPEEELREWEK